MFGSGKSTILKIIVGLLRADAGAISVNGARVDLLGSIGFTVIISNYSEFFLNVAAAAPQNFSALEAGLRASAFYVDVQERLGGRDDPRLVPLLAGLVELLPWLKQWHNDPDPAFDGLRMGDYFEGFVNEESRQIGKTVPDISVNAVANLGYADFRFADCGWRKAYPNLDRFHQKMLERPSVTISLPPAG